MKPTTVNVAVVLKAAAFAADKHRDQRRKNVEASPYINHPLEVACLLAESGVQDEALLAAALLHDTIEDTATEYEELEREFGSDIATIVGEVTDDKSLEKTERKRLQIEHAKTASASAKQLKIADKTCNIRDIVKSPPHNWALERKQEYLDWAVEVVSNCLGVNATLDAIYEQAISAARSGIQK
ncbi:MAG: HD domain-containing protein [Gammaproteobacteria bacterium]|nr:HD domain-containing protein [Gammaproteobacteria bacterium]